MHRSDFSIKKIVLETVINSFTFSFTDNNFEYNASGIARILKFI